MWCVRERDACLIIKKLPYVICIVCNILIVREKKASVCQKNFELFYAEREKTLRANKTHARSMYKEPSLIFRVKIASRTLIVIILFIPKGYYSSLNNYLLLIKKRA